MPIFQNLKDGLALDIDETLSWTVGYWVEEMQRLFGNPENLSPKELVDKYQYVQSVPYWQSDEITEWIKQQMHSNELQEKLPLIKDADYFVEKIHEIIPITAYVTSRVETTNNGTRKWLAKHGFPEAEIIAKPASVQHSDNNAWKASVLQSLWPKIKGIIDDNQRLVHALGSSYKGTVFLYGHKTEPETEIKAVPCQDWKAVYESVKRVFG